MGGKWYKTPTIYVEPQATNKRVQNSPPAAVQLAQRVSPTARKQRRAIEQITQPRSSKGEDGVAIAGRLISRPQALLLLASAGVASAVCC